MSEPADINQFTPTERKSAATLSFIFALRMLGLFLILPVFAVYAEHLEGGESAFAVGLTLGIYGLTQGCLQIPFGAASDKWGRKPVIAAGLLIFAAGSFAAASGDSVWTVMAGRALQGAGAVSAAVTAMLSESVRDRVLTKAMALVGSSIGITFALSLVLSPVLAQRIGVAGLFFLTGVLSLIAVYVILRVVPNVATTHAAAGAHSTKMPWQATVFDLQLIRMNVGIFILHCVQMALFVVIPIRLRLSGLAPENHWMIYLPAVLLSFVVLLPALTRAERAGRMKALFLGAVLLLAGVFAVLTVACPSLWGYGVLLLAFFCGFNVLEAMLPSFVSRTAHSGAKGLALGVYNTTQSLGLFAGGALGGWISQAQGHEAVFLFCLAAVILWLVTAIGMKTPQAHRTGEAVNI